MSRRKKNKALKTLGLAALTVIGASSLVFSKDTVTPNAVSLTEVFVRGQADSARRKSYTTSELSLSKFSAPLLDTPQSASVVSKQLLDDQHITTMRDAVRNVAGISIAAGEGGNQGDSLTLRGFSARNDIFLDGMRDFGSYYRDSFNWESVEVLKGPSSIAFGRGSTGGVVNQKSKTPELKKEQNIEFTLGSNQKERLTADVNEPLPTLGTGAAFRLNIMHETSKVAGRNVVENTRSGYAPSLSLGLGTSTRATFSYLHQQESDVPDYGIPWLFNAPAPVSRSNFYGFKSDFLKTSADIHTVKIEHDLTPETMISNQFRAGHYARIMRATEPKILGTPTTSTDLSTIGITRNEINTNSQETFLQDQLELKTEFQSFGKHKVVTGIEVGRETSDPTRYTITGVPTTNMMTPNTDQSFAGTYTSPTVTKVSMDTLAVYALDTLTINDQWSVIGGARWDQLNTNYQQNSTKLTSTDQFTSLRGAVIYKPVEDGSVYLSYGSSFNPSAESLSLSVGNASLAPEQNTSYELGTKWEFANKKLSVRGALFRTDKLNARETSANNSAVIVLAGAQRVEGFEVEATGALSDKWNLTAGYAYMSSQVLSSQFFPSAIGNPLANVPKNTFNLWTTYDVTPAFSTGFGGNFVDARRSSSTVPNDPTTGLPKEVPSYWVFNAMMSYHFTPKWSIQLNINNIFDTYYIDQIHPSHLVPGEARTFIVSSKIGF